MACCSSWGPKFRPQHLHWIVIMSALMNLMSSSGLWGYLNTRVPTHTHTDTHTHTHTHTHTQTVIIISGLKMIDGSLVQMACCFSWGPKLGSQHLRWIIIMSALMNLMSFSGFWGYLHTHTHTHKHTHTHNTQTHTHTVIIIKGLKWIDGSVVQMACCSSWGPKLGSQLLHSIFIMSTLMNLMSSSGLWGYLLKHVHTYTHTHTHTQTNTHTHSNNN